MICFIVCFIFSLQAVVAADVGQNSTDTVKATHDIEVVESSNVSAYSLPDSNQILRAGNENAGTFTDLQNDLNTVGTTVTLEKNYTYSDSDNLADGITLPTSITKIDGQGKVILDANHLARIFNIDSGHAVTLTGITFVNANANGNGGSINASGAITIENCNFINNTASGHGGAVYLDHPDMSVISGSDFTGNVAGLNGGAIDWSANSHNGIVRDSTFTNNTAHRSGGAIHWSGHYGTITNSNFTDNNATGDKVTTINGVLGGGDGGAVIWVGSNGTINNNCRFVNNTAAYRGGAIFLHGNSTENCTNVTVDDCYFEGNDAGLNGGAINWQKNSTDGKLTNSIFINNTAARNGGAVFWYGINGIVTGCEFTNNTAWGTVDSDDRQYEDGTPIENYIDDQGNEVLGGSGGAIVWTGSIGLISDCNFTSNNANRSGGAVFLRDNSNTTFKNSRFINNTARINGGALNFNRYARNGTVDACTFEGNIANRSAGAIFWFGRTGTITNSNFTDNKALGIEWDYDSYGVLTNGGYGGAIMWTGANGIVDNCRFEDNEAARRGGAVYLQGSDLGNCTNTTFNKSTFISNHAGTNGGAVDWHEGASEGRIYYSTFIDNTANANGGAVYWRGHNGQILYSNFTHNIALGLNKGTYNKSGEGGAIYWAGMNGTIENCRFIENEAKKNVNMNASGRGGAVYLEPCEHGDLNTTFIDDYFAFNTADMNGGAITFDVGAHNCVVDNSNFINNTAKRSGGAIFWNGVNGTIKYSKFYNNTALGTVNGTSVLGEITYGGDGGAVLWAGALGDVEHSNFVNNTAANRGGAIFLHASDRACENTTFKHDYFANNVAGQDGGAINWNKGARNGVVDDVIFFNNTARRSGGAIFWNGINGTLKNSRFINNRATGEAWEYTLSITMDDIQIVTDPDFFNTKPTSVDGKLYVLNQSVSTEIDHFASYVAHDNGTDIIWLKLDEEDILRSKSIISPVDWAIDQYYGGDGGTILWSGDIGLVYNCSFVDSNSARRGGGAYMTGSNNVTYDLCNFTHCTSGTNGGGVDWLAGANYGKIYNCIFNETRAARSAGAIYYDGDYGEMKNITIINTKAWGGSLKQSDDKLVNYAGWDSSHWDTNTTGGDAGAIMFTGDHAYLYNVTFTNCTATGRGGAVFLQDNTNITFDLCTFKNNRALGIANNTYNDARDTSSGLNKWYTGNGGAIGFDKGASNGTIKNSYFFNNTAARNGGAISFSVNSTDADIFNSSFVNNTAYRSGGAIEWDGNNGNVSYCNFTGNSALGTAISTDYANITSLSDVINRTSLPKPSIATDNKLYVLVIKEGDKNVRYELYVSQVSDMHYWLKIDETTETGPSPIDWAIDEYFGGDGGSIMWSGDNAHIDNCIFTDSNSARRGGGAYMTGGDHVEYTNCTFENCTSGTNGGGLDWLAGANYGKVIDCNFTNTQAARSAGAIYYDGDYGEFRNIIIMNTTAHGGDLYESEDGKVKYARWDSSHWDTNTTGGDGGAMMITGDHIKLYNVNITDSTAAGRGGAIFVQDNDNVTIELCTFENNHALGTANNTYNDHHDTSSGINKNLTGHGGAISFDIGASDSSIINSTFINNTAVLYGGAVHFREGATEDKIINSTFEKNYASEDGGALFVNGFDCELHNSTFYDNYAGDDGGAIYWNGGDGIIHNITCVNNRGISSHGNSKGGSLCLVGDNMVLSDSTFNQSYAKVTGGAIFATGNYVNITGCDFYDCNVSNSTGGAIQILGDHILVSDCTVEECHATYGSAIYAEGQYTQVVNSTFTRNNATEDGGAVYVSGDYSELHNSTFTYNIAGDDGGAIYWEGDYGTIYNITCENNKGISLDDSNSNGGTICITGNDITLSESTFVNSSAVSYGGAIYVTGNRVSIETSEFETCNSTTQGGAIYILGNETVISQCIFEDCIGTQGGAIYVEGDDATISANITDTHAIGADSYGITVDYKFYKDIIKVVKREMDSMITYFENMGNETISDADMKNINKTLHDLQTAIDNILTNDGINTTNRTIAINLLAELNETLTQLNGTLPSGNDKNNIIKLLGDVKDIDEEFDYIVAVSESFDVHDDILSDIEAIIAEVNDLSSAEDKNDLLSTLNKLKEDVERILDGNTYNSTYVEDALKLLDELNDKLKELNETASGNDKTIVDNLLGEVKDTAGKLNSLSDLVVVPEVVASGGAIYISGNEALIENSVINSTDAVYGGGIYITGHDVTVDRSEFINLYSSEDGGAIYITGQAGNLYNSKFINNTAGDDGGAINWDGNYGTIYNITCENNKGISLDGSSSNGGTISLTGNDTSIEKSSFKDTYALISGGAIFVTGNRVNITDSEFENCNVSMNIAETGKSYANGGGAIYVMGNSSNIVNCTFDNSDAREGGAIYVQGRDVTINKSNFTDSTAFNGGTIYIHGDRAIVIGCILNNTIAGDDSHALFDENLDVSAFEEGLLGKGGAIYIKSENAQILDTTITLSNATFEGGAIYVEGNNATISVDFVDCGAGYPIEWVTPDRDVFKPLISNILIRVNGLIAYNNDINNGFSDNFTNIYNLIYSIREKLVNKIFNNKILNVDNLHAAIDNLTELSNAIPLMVTDTDLLNSLELSSLIQLLRDIPDDGTYNSYYNSKVKPVYDGLATRMNYAYILGNDNSYLYKRLQLIKNNLVDKIFIGNSHTFNAANLNAAIGNLTEVYDCVKYAENDGSYDEFLNNLSIAKGTLQSIPSDATYSAYDDVRKTASNNINSLMTYSRSIKNNYVAYKNNLNTLKTKLNNLPKQTTLREFNRAVYDISVIINNIEANLDLLLEVYAGNDLTDVLNNFTYVKSQITLIQNAGESLQNLGVSGGAIYVAGDDTNITGSTFLRCLASNALKGEGGAIYITGANTTITGSDFMNCSAPDNGGSIYVNGTNAKVEKSTFNITTAEVGGAIYILGSETTIDSSSFVDSSADYRGGAIYIEGLKATVKDSNFTDSEVTGGIFNNTNPRGGAIYIKENYATVEGSIFNNSSVSTTVGDGGAIYIEGDYAKILGSEFEYSSAHVGGAIYLEGDSCNVSESTFTYSLANENGGAMYSTGSKSTVYNSNFTNNLAELSGGGVYWFGGSKSKYNTVDGCIFTNNTAHGNTGDTSVTRGGGAIYWSEGGERGTVKNSEFYYNSVQSTIDWKVDGGAVLWDKSSHALVDNCTFIGNFVTTNGDSSSTTAASCWAQGGAMYLRPNTNYTVRNCLFENCSSSKEAGALYIQGQNSGSRMILLENSVFKNNVAYANGQYNINGGGAIQIKQCYNAVFNNLTFINNTANKGGALCVYDSVYNLVVTGANFTENKANRGSAISASVTFTLNDAVLLDNRADTSTFDLTLDRAGSTIDILLEGNDNRLNAMYVKGSKSFSVTCNNVTYWTDNNISIGKTNVTSSPQSSGDIPVPEAGISITVELFDANNNKLNEGNDIFATDANGELHLIPSDFGLSSFENVYVKARLTNENYYTQVEATTRLPASMEANAHNVTYHRNATVNVTITPSSGHPATGIVSVYYGDVFLGNITIDNNVGISDEILTNITADKFLEVGTHNLTLKYWGDLYNDAINITVPINVTKAQSNITFTFDEMGYNLFVNVTIVDQFDGKYYEDANGNVTVTVYRKGTTLPMYIKTVYLINGTGSTFFDLLPANYTIKAEYHGDDNYNASVNSSDVELHKKEDVRILIDINATDIMVDETVYINITVLTNSIPATGNVTLYLDNNKYILPLTDSKATFNTTGLSEGFKIVTVVYDGSKDLQANYGDANFTVLKYNTTFSVNVTNITHNQKEIINITFVNETEGVVYIYVNDGNYSAIINNRTAILELSDLTVGEYNVTVKFPGDWKYNNVTNMTKFYVEQITPEIVIDVDNVTYGDPTKIIITLPDCVKGDVSIKIDGTPYGTPKQIENGRVEFDLGNLNAGNYTVEAIYGGDINHTEATIEKKFRVYKANRTVEIEVQDIVYGSAEHITVHVDAEGNVTITVNGKSETIILDNGVAELDVYNLAAKTYTVDVTYNGNENYNKSSASETFDVAKMTTSLDVQVHDGLVRGMEYLNITVRNSTGGVAKALNGTLTLYIDGVKRTANIINGIASFNSTEFNSVVGTRVVWAFFEGNVNFTESKAMKTYQVTTRTLSDDEWNVTAKNIYVGQAGNITVNLPKDVTGFVEIEVKAYGGYRDDTYYKMPDDGVAVIYPKDLREGMYHVYVTYIGTDYEESYLDTYFRVSKAQVNVTIDVNDTVYDNSSNIVVYVDEGVEGSITLKINTTVIGTFAIVDGKVNTTVKLGAGNYIVYAEYNGNYMYLDNKTESKSFTVERAVPVISIDPVTVDANTSAIIIVHINDTATGTMNITVNKKNYTAVIDNGIARFTIDVLPAGIYNVTANYYALTDTNYTTGSKYIEVGVTVNKVTPYPMNVSAVDVAVEANTTIVVCVPTDATGNVTIWVNGTKMNKTITDSSGKVVFTLNKTIEGKYTVNATLSDAKYANQTVYTTYYVYKVDTPLSIGEISQIIYVNDTVTITVTAPSDLKNNVTIEINGKSYNYTNRNDNTFTFTVPNITYGNKTVVAIYGGDNKYKYNSTTRNFTVSKRASQVNVTAVGNSVGNNATISVKVQSNATGYVTVNVNGTNYTIKLNNVGEGSVKIAGLGNGTYYVHATYLGDEQYLTSENNTETFEMVKVAPEITIVAQNVTYGNHTVIVVSVSGATGNITIRINETDKGEFTLVNGKVTFDAGVLGVENYTVYVSYLGDDKYATGDAQKDFNVSKATPTIVINEVTVDALTNASVIVTINTDASGKMNITVNDKNYTADIIEGVATFTVDVLPVNLYDIAATYAGDDNYTGKVETLADGLNITKVQTYKMNVTALDVVVGENTTITVHVPKDATGTVTIWVNGTSKVNSTIVDGVATFTLNKTAAGRYVVNATLSDVKYADQTVYTSYLVSKVETPITITVVNKDTIKVGDTAVITVELPDEIAGEKVTIEINGKSYENATNAEGFATFNVPSVTYGNKTVTAIYAGNNKYVNNATTANFTVTIRASQVNVTPVGNSVGNNATISVKVQSNATGYVTVNVNGTNYTIKLNNIGEGSVEIAGLGNGTYYVHATYLGDDQYLTSTNNTETFVMTKSDVIMNITVEDINYGQAANITVNITSDATGFITIRINETTSIILPIGSGKVNWIVDGLAADNYTVYATYSGDGKYNVNNTDKVNKSFEVKQIAPGVEIVKVISQAGGKATVIVKVDPRTTENVTVTVNNVPYSVKPDDAGIAVIITDVLENGTYTVTARYGGDKNFTDGEDSFTFTTNKTSDYEMNITTGDIEVDQLTNITVNVPDDAKGIVIVNINGTNYTAVIHDGKAVFNNETGLGAGRYNITAYFGNDKYANRTATGVFIINKHESPVTIAAVDIKVGDVAYINVTAPSDNVTIEINGKSYTRTKYENGVAYFAVPALAYGNKTVTAIYGGSDKYVANTTTENFTVNKRASQVNVTGDVIIVRENATVKVNVTPGATGYVVVTVNNQNYTINLTESQGSVDIAGLNNQTYSITVTYLGDDQYLSSSNNTQLIKVNKVDSTINLTVSEDGIIANGSDVNITVEVPMDATGKVEVSLWNGNELIKTYAVYVNEGKGLLYLDSPAIGLYNVTARYLGDDKYLESSNKTSFEVYETVEELIIDVENIFVNDTERIFVIIPGYHAGEVTIIVTNATGEIIRQNVTIDEGSISIARLPLGLLPEGKYDVRAIYVEVNGTKTILHKGTDSFNVYKLASDIQITEIVSSTVGNDVIIRLGIDLDGRVDDGNISVWVNGVEYKTTTDNLEITLKDLNASAYNVIAVYHGNKWYNESKANSSFIVNKNPIALAVEVSNSDVGEIEQINVTLNETDATGVVLLDIGGNSYYANITGGVAVFRIEGLKAGTYNFNATYLGNYKYYGNNTKSSTVISKLPTTFVVNGTDITFGSDELIKFETADNITSVVKVEIDGRNYTAFISEGKGNLTVSGLSAGSHNVTVYFEGNDKFSNASAKNNFTVMKGSAEIEIAVDNVTYGEITTVNVYVNATGNVTIRIDGIVDETVDIINGVATLPISGLNAGNYTVDVTYNGNTNVSTKDGNADFTVKKAAPEIVIEVKDIPYGDVEYIIVHVNAEGTVTIRVDGEERTLTTENGKAILLRASRWAVPEYNGNATLEVRGLAVGTYPVEATFNGNANYEKATATSEFDVYAKNTTVSVEIEPEIKVGETQVINITVDNVDASGEVIINIDGKNYTATLTNGSANFTTPKLAAGNHSVVVIYEGDKNLNGNWTSDTFEVTKLESDLTINVNNNTVGEKQTITVNVTDGATGYVGITVGDKEYKVDLENGIATLELDGLTNGTYEIVAKYYGDDNYTTSQKSAQFNISRVNSTVSVKADNITVGDKTVIAITVPQDATGNVTVKVGESTYIVPVANGTGILVLNDLDVGSYPIDVTYNGDDKYLPNTNSTTFKVSKVNVTDIKVIDHENGTVVVVVGDNATGNVTIKVGDKEYNATVVNGTAVVTLDGNVTPGTHEVEVIYSGDDTHEGTTTYANITAPKYDAPIEIEVGEAKEGEPVTITVTVPENATGNVTVNVGGKEYNATVENGKAVVTIPELAAGNHTIAVEYHGDDNYTASSTVGNATVEPAKIVPDMKVIDQGNGTVVVVVGDNATGNVTVTVDGRNYTAEVINGTAVVTLDGNVTPGTHEVEVIYSSDDTHEGASATTNITAPKYDTPMSIEVGEAKEGEPVNITVSVPKGATGDVIISVGGKNYTAPIKDGKASVAVDGISAGDHTVAAEYFGDDNYVANYTLSNLTNDKAKVNPDMKVIDQGNGTIVVVVGDNATGNVTVSVDGQNYTAEVINGTAVITLDNNVTPGTHEVEVVYSGDETHNASSTVTNITAPKYDTPIEVEIGEAKEGEPVTITVTVPENATGNVTLSVDGKDYTVPVENGKAVITVPELSDGNKTYVVSYSGDDNYAHNSSVGNFTVDKAKETSGITVVDQGNGTVVVVVGDNATGNVTVTVDGRNYTAEVVNGTAVITLDNNVTPGTHEVEVIYSGDDTHEGASATTNITAPKYDTPMSIEVGEAKEGEPVNITVTVPKGATGDVIISVGGKNYTAPIKDGKASVTVDGISAGDHTVAAEYFGDDNYVANYTLSNLTNEKAKETPDMKVIDKGNGTIVVVVGDNATGNVTVTIDGQNYTAEVVNGTAVVNLENITPGTHEVEVMYSGDETHDVGSVKTNVTGPKADTPFEVAVENIKVGDKETIVVSVPEDATGEITIEIDGEKYTAPIIDGKATFTVEGFTDGKKSVFVSYGGDENYNANTTTVQFNVSKRDSTLIATIEDIEVGDNLTVTVKLPENATGQVLIDIDGVGYYVNVTNGTGTCEIPRLPSGEYNVTLTYTGDDQYAPSSASKTFKVDKVESFVIPTASNIVVGENENVKIVLPADATGTVTVVVDGKNYITAVSDGKGELIIPGLSKGEYEITVIYNGDEKYLPSTNTTIFTVSKIDTTMEVIDQGNGTVKVILPSDATGTVTVTVDGKNYTADVVNGTATIVLDDVTPGKHPITVSYSGDNEYASKKQDATVDIPKYDTPMSATVNDISVGEKAVIVVNVPDKATGEITVEIDGKTYTGTIKDGKAEISIPDLSAGDKTAIIKYAGDENYLENSTSVSFKVSKVNPTIKATPKDITVGKDEVITVDVPKDATGQVLVEINGVGYYADIVNGKAKVIIPKLDAGKYTAKVTYIGDDKYNEISTTTKFTVKKVSTGMSATSDEIYVGEDASVSIKLPKDATGTVTITVYGKKFKATVSDGKAVFVISGLPEGVYDAVVHYSGDDKYNATTTRTTIIVHDDHNGTPDNGEHSSHVSPEAGEGIDLSTHATGNPIWILLLIVLALGSTQIRRFRK